MKRRHICKSLPKCEITRKKIGYVCEGLASKRYYGGNSEEVIEMNPLNGKPFSDQYYEIQKQANTLPMNQPETVENLLNQLDKFQLTLLTAETGAGKTTSIGQHMLHYLRKIKGNNVKIVLTQPRQLAAQSIAGRVANELDVEIGKEVGYRYKGAYMFGDETKILFMTEGVLVLQFKQDPDISDIDAVIIDEAHERNVETDLLLLFLKRLVLRGTRPDLKIIIMSATADTDTFKNYFPNSGFIAVEGRAYAVDVRNGKRTPKDADEYIEMGIQMIINICKTEGSGDILFFLATRPELRKGREMLEKNRDKVKGSFAAFEFASGVENADDISKKAASHFGVDRKIVFSTNVAEASVTIDGIVFIVDSGRVFETSFDFDEFQCGTSGITFVSQAASRQRQGRAGRTRPGIAFRLYTEVTYNSLKKFTTPKILQTDITTVCLGLLDMPGASNIRDMWDLTREMITPPTANQLEYINHNLRDFGVIDNTGELTPLGQRYAYLDCDIPLARTICFSGKYGCYDEIISISAMIATSGDRLLSDFMLSKDKDDRLNDPYGEVFSLLKIARSAFTLRTESEIIRFCKAYRLNQAKIDDATKNFRDLRAKYLRMFEQAPRYIENTSLLVDIPYFQKDWITSPISGDIRERITRCLLHGYFPKTGIFREGKYYSFVKHLNLKIKPEQIKRQSPMCLYLSSTKGRFGQQTAGVLAVKDVVWFLDAAEHFYSNMNPKHDKQLLLDAATKKASSTGVPVDFKVTQPV